MDIAGDIPAVLYYVIYAKCNPFFQIGAEKHPIATQMLSVENEKRGASAGFIFITRKWCGMLNPK